MMSFKQWIIVLISLCYALNTGLLGQIIPQVLRIASWNVRDYNLSNRRLWGEFKSYYPKPETEKKALRQVIINVNPDILALQEIGGSSFLLELQADLKADGLDYPYNICLDEVGDSRKLAFLSRYPPLDVMKMTDIFYTTATGHTYPVLRGCLVATFQTIHGPLACVNLHFKSKIETQRQDAADRRRGEALAVQRSLERIFGPIHAWPAVIMGDFNDHPRSDTVYAFLKKNNQTIGHLLDIKDSHGTTWTYTYQKENAFTRIDHLIATEALIQQYQDQSKTASQPIGRIADTFDVLQASDHRLIYFDL